MMNKSFCKARRALVSSVAVATSAMFPSPAAAKLALCTSSFDPADQQGAKTDMVMRSEAIPTMAANQRLDWLLKGRVGLGNETMGANRLLPWVAVFATQDNQLGSARVELSNLEVYVLSKKTAMWRLLSSSPKVSGKLFTSPGGTQSVGPIDTEQSDGVVSIGVDERYMSHFWSYQKLAIDPHDIAGVYVSAVARMNPEDYAAGARYVMDAAADYYRVGTSTTWLNDAGIGRLKLLTPQWRKYYMTTVKQPYLDLCIG